MRRARRTQSDASSLEQAAAGSFTGHRHERLSRVFREELEALLRDEVGDPRLDGVVVTSVELSVDYRHARIGYTSRTGLAPKRDERDALARALARATPFLRARLSEALDLKQVPALRFVWDDLATRPS
jgi:ribosome-binding factor A